MKRLFPRRLTERPNSDVRRVFACSVTSDRTDEAGLRLALDVGELVDRIRATERLDPRFYRRITRHRGMTAALLAQYPRELADRVRNAEKFGGGTASAGA
jgi:hypothetical protein